MIRVVQLFRSATLLLLLSTIAPAQPVTRLIYGAYLLSGFSDPTSIDAGPVIRAAATGPDGSTVVANVETRIIPMSHSGSTYAYDASVTKLGADGKTLFSITLSNAVPIGIAVDANSNTYICGATFGDFTRRREPFKPRVEPGSSPSSIRTEPLCGPPVFRRRRTLLRWMPPESSI